MHPVVQPSVVSLFAGIGGFDLGFARAGCRTVATVEIDKNCRRLLSARWPDAVHLDDVRTAGRHNLPECDVVTFGFPCFVSGTVILTKSGLIPIECVRVGDEVYTHKSRWRKVTSVMHRETENTVCLKGGVHFGLTTTEEHPFWASAGRKRKYKPNSERRRWNWYDAILCQPEWVEAKNMQGKYWSTPILDGDNAPPSISKILGKGKKSPIPEMTPELFWVLGAWVGDGWLRYRKDRGGKVGSVIICAPESETGFLKEKIDKAGLVCTLSKDRTVNKLIISHRALAEWILLYFGSGAKGKRIPGWLFETKRELREAFLDGYIWADGSRFDGGWKITTVNRGLAFATVLLGISLGAACSIYYSEMKRYCKIEGRQCNQSDQYQVVGRLFKKQTSAFVINKHSFSKCRSICKTGRATVYNISVEEDESYVADGIVVHNCQDLSIAGKRAGLEGKRSGLFYEAMRIIDELNPAWAVWENVPGLLSSDNGRDLARVLFRLGESGYFGCVRCIDAQWLGVAQRRRRLFGVFTRLDSGVERCAEILSIAESLRGHPAPSREAGQGTTRRSSDGAGVSGTLDRKSCWANRGSQANKAEVIAIQDVRGVDKAQNGRGHNGDGTAYTVDAMATQGVCVPDVAGTMPSRASGVGGGPGAGTDEAAAGYLIPTVAGTLMSCTGGWSNSADHAASGYMIPAVAGCLQERDAKGEDSDTKPRHLVPVRNSGRGYWRDDDTAATLGTEARSVYEGTLAVAFERRFVRTTGGQPNDSGVHPCLKAGVNNGDGAPCVAGCLSSGAHPGGCNGQDAHNDMLIPVAFDMTHGDDPARLTGDKTNTLQSRMGTGGNQVPCVAFERRFIRTSGGQPNDTGVHPCLRADTNTGDGAPCVAFSCKDADVQAQPAHAAMQVRRLTPREAERLQGFQWRCSPTDHEAWQDELGRWWSTDYTADFSDSVRYRMLGNAVCVNVAEWIAKRLVKEARRDQA